MPKIMLDAQGIRYLIWLVTSHLALLLRHLSRVTRPVVGDHSYMYVATGLVTDGSAKQFKEPESDGRRRKNMVQAWLLRGLLS